MLDKNITLEKFLRGTVICLIVVAAFLVIYYLRSVLLPFFVASGLAYLLYPLVKFFEDKLKVKVRALSIILTLLTVIAVLVGMVWLIIPPMVEQFGKFLHLVSTYIMNAAHVHDVPQMVQNWIDDNSREIEKFLKSDDFISTIQSAAPKAMSLVGDAVGVVKGIIGSFIVLMYMFFILLDYEDLGDGWLRIFPQSVRPFWKDLSHDAGIALNSYVRGQGLVALIMGILFCIGFTIIDFPMAIGLGILIGILDLVPYLHTFALIPTAFLAGLKALDTGENFWMIFGMAVIVFCVVQVIIDMIVTPKVMGGRFGLNPAVLLLSLSVWGALLGFLGLIIAFPLTSLLMAYWKKYVSDK